MGTKNGFGVISGNLRRIHYLCYIFLLFTFPLFAQKGFKLGIQGGLPFGDYNEKVSLTLGVDVGYMYPLGEVVDLGVMTGFVNGFSEEYQPETLETLVDFPPTRFVPLALSTRIWPSRNFSFGIDGGHAFGVSEDFEGGWYYRPLIGFLMGAQTEVNFSYTGIDDVGGQWSTVNFGILYTFPTGSPY